MKIRISLESKICILVGGLLFGLLLAVGMVQMERYSSNLLAEKKSEYQGMANMLAMMFSPMGSEAGLNQYNAFTKRFMDSDPDIAYVMISDSHGNVAYTNTRKVEESYKGILGVRIGKRVSAKNLFLDGAEQHETIRIPATVRPGERGTITVGFVTHSIDSALGLMRSDLLYTFATALLIGILLAMLIAKAVTRPLHDLMRAAGRVAEDHLDVQVQKTSNDEVGDLVDHFNTMVKALTVSRDRLVERASTDSLTDLRNHRFFQESLRSEMKRTERYGRPVSVIMIDIDDFKNLNDTHGHPVGDSILQEVAKILAEGARADIDMVCRYGGEEFSIILPETNVEDAYVVAERIRENVANHFFLGKDQIEICVTISLGVAEHPIHSEEREGLVMAADLALYQSKSLGKNRTTVFSNDTRKNKSRDPYKLCLLLNATDTSTLEAIAVAVDAKGNRSPESSKIVGDHSVALAKKLGMSEVEQRDVRIASLLRDIGKLGIAASVLNKEGSLSDEERTIVQSHTTLGYSVVQKSPHLKSMLPGILHHHERWDGTGYPKALKGEDTPLVARIIGVVDAYHAMISDRPYSRGKSLSEAVEELRRESGKQFDPRIVECFLEVLSEESSTQAAA